MFDVDKYDCTYEQRSQWLSLKDREISQIKLLLFMQMDVEYANVIFTPRYFNHFVTFLKFLHENINLYMFFFSKKYR